MNGCTVLLRELYRSYTASVILEGACWFACLANPEVMQRSSQRLHEAQDLFFLEAFAHDL